MTEVYPLSVGQEALWFLYELAPDNPSYNVAYAVRVLSEVDGSVLSAAVSATVERHELLRSVFRRVDGTPSRIPRGADIVRLEVRDVPDVSEEELRALAETEVGTPFRLADAGPLRVVLLRRAPQDAVLLVIAHHIASDITSHLVVLRDLLDAYLAGGEPAWEPAEYTYQDHVRRERDLIASPRLAQLAEFWREVCAGAPPELALPTDRPRPARQRFVGGTVNLQVPENLDVSCAELGITPFVHLSGVLTALLHRYSAQDDFLIGCASTSRTSRSMREVVGYFANSLPLRASFTSATTFRELTTVLQRQVVQYMTCLDYPFALLPRALGVPRQANRSPLFQVLVVSVAAAADPLHRLIISGSGGELAYGDLRLAGFDLAQQAGQFDLTVEFWQRESGVRIAFMYDVDLFDQTTIERFAAHFHRALTAVLHDPDITIRDVPLVDDAERARLLSFTNG
jgi:Condensation domain